MGGKTKFYGAALFRMRPEDFGELRHHDGISPAWPLSYEELEPYYTQAEHLYLVHGRHGEDPTEGPTSAEYAYPPAQHEPRIDQLSHDLEKQGLHPFHLPIGRQPHPGTEPGRATHTSACIRCDRVDGFPCLVGAKADVQAFVARRRRQLRRPAAAFGERPASAGSGQRPRTSWSRTTCGTTTSP